MKKESQEKMFDHFSKFGITHFVGVPDSTMKYFLARGINKKKIIITTREEEAIGIASGISLSNGKVLVFMQNAGFANSISTITSLVQLYDLPMIFLIGWRGYLKNDAPEHITIGKIQPKLLKLLGLNTRIIKDDNWKDCCKWALNQINQNKSCGLIIRRTFND